MDRALQVISIIVSIALVILVLMQAKGAGLGDLLGGGESGGITRTRRGLEKTLFQITVGLGFLFLMVAILSFALNS